MSTNDAFYQSVVDQTAAHINPGLARLMAFAGFGVEMSAEGCWITDHEGRRYLDCLGGYGVFSLGHRHPAVVAAVKKQLDEMPMGAKAFFNARSAELATRLSELTGSKLPYAFFCNSGAEAVEAALKFAKLATGRTKVIATHGGYHGKTLGALSVTGREKYRTAVGPLMPGAVFMPYGDAVVIEAEAEGAAAVIVEPVQGEGGIIVPPEGYLRRIREICDRHGALMIADEIQTGLGRTGYLFACEAEGVTPDLMTLAKCLGGGVMPIGAVLGTTEIWDIVFGENPLMHTSTFGGNEMACAAALAALTVIEEEALVEKSRSSGEVFLEGLVRLAEKHPQLVLEARGRGLMLGLEFRVDEVGELVVSQLLIRQVIAAYTLNNPRVLRIEPPLTISAEEIAFALAALDEALTATRDMLVEFGVLSPSEEGQMSSTFGVP